MAQETPTSLAAKISTLIASMDASFDAASGSLTFGPDARPRANAAEGQAVGAALEALFRLQKMLLGPLGSLLALGSNEFDLAVLHVIIRFDIAAAIPVEPADAQASFTNIAAHASLDENMVTRLLRHGMTNGVFRESESHPGMVAHTPVSRGLAVDPLIRSTASMLCNEQFPAAAALAGALGAKDGVAAWSRANGTEKPMYAVLGTTAPERRAAMDLFMMTNWTVQAPLGPLVAGFDWAALGDASVVVDLGGGLGAASIALARAHPNLQLIVQDAPATVARGREQLPKELVGRVQFAAHDVSDTQPVEGAAVYLLRSVLHACDDEHAAAILRALVPALRPGSKILVHDYCMPPPGELSLMEERRARTVDLIQTALFNGREREAAEWESLFAQADKRFRFNGFRPMDATQTGMSAKKLLSLIEVTWSG